MTSAEERLARQIKTAREIAECHAIADRILSRARKSASLRKERTARASGPSREDRRKEEDRTEASGKLAARKRAEVEGSPRCEWFTDGVRCQGYGSDCDHVLGGAHKKDMEDLPNGEGFQVECRNHHNLKHGPGKAGHLAQAKEHAIRIGSKGLLRAVTKATALFEGKHGRAA